MKRLFVFFLVLVVMLSLFFPSYADDSTAMVVYSGEEGALVPYSGLPLNPVSGIGQAITITNLPDIIAKSWDVAQDVGHDIATWGRILLGDRDVCPSSSNHRHEFEYVNTEISGVRGWTYVCKYCGRYSGDIVDSAYTDYVGSLPASGIDSEGGLIWRTSFTDWSGDVTVSFVNNGASLSASNPSFSFDNDNLQYSFTCFDNRISSSWLVGSSTAKVLKVQFSYMGFYVPVAGTYTLMTDSPLFSGLAYDVNGDVHSLSLKYSDLLNLSSSDRVQTVSSSGVRSLQSRYASYNALNGLHFEGTIFLPVFRVVPTSGVIDTSSDTTYNDNSRVGSITGDYGIVGDNGTISVVENVTIVNEENNTFYNPATGETLPIDSWTYDYSDRSYDLQLGDDVGVKVKFDDAALTLDFSQGDTVEGDTVNNHYTYYYVTEYTNNSGGEDPEPTASPVPTDEPTPTDIPTPTDAPVPTDDPDNPVVVVIPTPVPVIADVPDGILTLRERLRELYNNLVEMLGDASSFLSDAFSFVPQEIGWLIEFSFALAIVVGIFRMFWK